LIALAASVAAPQAATAAGSGSFSPTGSMGTPRIWHAAAPLQDGRVLVVGGSVDGAGGPGGLATTELYSPATGTFAPGPPLGVIRNGAVAAPLKDGRVLVAGGRGPLFSAQVYNPVTNSFSATGFMGDAREGAAAAPLADGRVLVVGGTDDGGVTSLATAEIWDPATNLWTSTTGDMAETRYAPTAAPLADGRVLVVGGYSPGLNDTAEIYNPGTDTFSSAGLGTVTPVFGHRGAAAAKLPDGRVLVAGGDQAGGDNLAFAEAFDPATGAFSPAGIGAMGTQRGFTAAAPLSDGRVLVMGGSTGSAIVGTAEVFAATNTFTYSVSGRKLIVTVQAQGKLDIGPPPSVTKAAASKKGKRKRKALLRAASAQGGPGTIELPLLLTKAAKGKLKRKGKVKIPANITFSPVGGVANTQSVKLKVKNAKKKRKKKRN
jgi:hypothetical protein